MFRHLLILTFSSWAFAAPVPVAGRAPVPVDHLRVGNPAVFPMTGTWRFKLDHGVSPAVPATADRISWFSDSLWTEYPADHIGLPHGSFTSKDIHFSAPRRDIHWLSFNNLVALAGGGPLHAHAAAVDNGTMLFLSSGIAPTGIDVTGDDIRLTQATPLTGGFRLRVAAGSVK